MRLTVGLARTAEGEYHFFIEGIPRFKPFLDLKTYPEETIITHLLMVPRSHFLSAIQHDLMHRGVAVPDTYRYIPQHANIPMDKLVLEPGKCLPCVASYPLSVLETMKIKLYNQALVQKRNPADITPHANPPSETWADVFDMYSDQDYPEADRLSHVLQVEFHLSPNNWPPL